MKKFDTLISNYLYTNKKVDIEGIGSFSLDEHFVLPPDAEKGTFFPLEGVHLEHNLKAETSPGLIDYIIQHTGKIRSLVQADFSSYVAEIKQFVNIGKPWAIEGIGTLQKNKEGKFELIPGQVTAERVNMHYADEPEDDDEQPVRRRKWMVGFILALAIVAVVAGIGFGVYVLFIKTQDTNVTDPIATNVFTEEDTATLAADTTIRRDSLVTSTNDNTNYRVTFETTASRTRAVTRTEQLKEYGVPALFDSINVQNQQWYRLFIYQSIMPRDTTRIKDSLSLYFGRKVKLQRI